MPDARIQTTKNSELVILRDNKIVKLNVAANELDQMVVPSILMPSGRWAADFSKLLACQGVIITIYELSKS